ncbi:BtrH N-terminal domain-containing protein [Isobaculum melis]|nr:BtrH N-terminal domain-containing protein [Isobaculum melis]
MKLLKLPHQIADYRCPVNGICDIYEWKTGQRIPEGLLFDSHVGFSCISNRSNEIKKMLFFTGQHGVGRRQYEFWQQHIGFKLITGEGKTFNHTLKTIKSLVDQEIPVLLFGLDMFYLQYQKKFYQTSHIPDHVVMMVGYDEETVIVHDNSEDYPVKIPIAHLEKAWQDEGTGLSKKNAYFGIDMQAPEKSIPLILKQAYQQLAEEYLRPKVSLFGVKAAQRVIAEIGDWQKQYAKQDLKQIYDFIILLTGSMLPESYESLMTQSLGFKNPHQAMRDQFAAALVEYAPLYGNQNWLKAATLFAESGLAIQQFVATCIAAIKADHYEVSSVQIELLQRIQLLETEALTWLSK